MLTPDSTFTDDTGRDVVFMDAVELISRLGVASASLLQRHLKLGYARAARLLDELEQAEIIGPAFGARPREILINHPDREGKLVVPPYRQKLPPEPQPSLEWKKTKSTNHQSPNFNLVLGDDDNGKPVSFDLVRYGNLMIIGSQFTSINHLLNNIIATNLAQYSPSELKLIAVNGTPGDLLIPQGAPHLLCPVIADPTKVISVLKWTVEEISRRSKLDNQNEQPQILIVFSSFNQILCFSPGETEELIYRLISQGRKYGVFVVLGTDYPNPKSYKEILANTPAKLVFKPTDKKIARDTGIPESIDLKSPDEAILETMFESKIKLTITKLDVQKIYQEIFK